MHEARAKVCTVGSVGFRVKFTWKFDDTFVEVLVSFYYPPISVVYVVDIELGLDATYTENGLTDGQIVPAAHLLKFGRWPVAGSAV